MRIYFILIFIALGGTAGAQIKPNWPFRDELISYMQSPADTIYVKDRKQLQKVEGLVCKEPVATFNYTSKKGDRVFIKIVEGPFNPSQHAVAMPDTVFKVIHGQKRVDYRRPWPHLRAHY